MSFDTELRILRNPQSLRGINQIAPSFGLTSEQMIQLLNGKTVLDLGSGYNGLAIDVILRKLNCQVLSVNPHVTDPDFEFLQKEKLNCPARINIFSDFDPQKIEQARQASIDNTFALFAHDLKYFPNAEFDLIIDHLAIFAYYENQDEYPEFLQTIAEEKRVLKPSAPTLIADNDVYFQKLRYRNWKENILRAENIPFLPTVNPRSIIAYFNGQ